MTNIYATKMMITQSKLFQCSSRQSKILAAMENPINSELLEQLDEYVGDNYRNMLNTDESTESEVGTTDADTWNFDEDSTKSSSDSKPSPANFTPNSEKLSEKYEDELSDLDNPDSTQTKENSDKSVDSSTILSATPITSTVSNLAISVKSTLNASKSTAGVSRVAVKGDEVWVHYIDSINLNSILSSTIEACSLLTFNRLARTENAIVFTLNGDNYGKI